MGERDHVDTRGIDGDGRANLSWEPGCGDTRCMIAPAARGTNGGCRCASPGDRTPTELGRTVSYLAAELRRQRELAEQYRRQRLEAEERRRADLAALEDAVTAALGPWAHDGLGQAVQRVRDAAYRAGAEAMRERAAGVVRDQGAVHASVAARSGRGQAMRERFAMAMGVAEHAIRALPVEPPEGAADTCGSTDGYARCDLARGHVGACGGGSPRRWWCAPVEPEGT